MLQVSSLYETDLIKKADKVQDNLILMLLQE